MSLRRVPVFHHTFLVDSDATSFHKFETKKKGGGFEEQLTIILRVIELPGGTIGV